MRVKRIDFRYNHRIFSPIAANGLTIGAQGVVVGIGVFFMQRSINALGADVITVITLGRQAGSLAMFLCAAFQMAISVYCGQNLGAGKPDRIFKGIRVVALITAVWVGVMMVAMFFLGTAYCSLFMPADKFITLKDDLSVLLRISLLYYPGLGFLYMFRGVIQGLGYGYLDMIGGIVEAAAYIGMSYAIISYGFPAACWSMIVIWTAGCLYAAIAYLFIRRRIHREALNIKALNELVKQ